MAAQDCSSNFLVFAVILASLSSTVFSTNVRGVSTSRLSFYNPGQDFSCLDGTVTIPFSYVNDDYCDCPDGSDEPGTAACPNGSFTCKNLGHKQTLIQSSRVNDDVCDCCDGSDEYESDSSCQNTCDEVGRAERERLANEKTVTEQGFVIRNEYINEGKQKKQDIEAKTKESKDELDQLKAKLEELKAAKEKAESFEKEAKEKQDKILEEIQNAKAAEEESNRIDEAFKKLDTDGNGLITVHEITSSSYVVKELTEEQAREKMSGESEIDRLKLHDIWSTFKEVYDDSEKLPTENADMAKEVPIPSPETSKENDHQDEAAERKATDFPPPATDGDDEEDDGDEADSAEEESDLPRSPPVLGRAENAASEAVKAVDKPDYDEETKRLISIADQTRKEYDEVDIKIKDTEIDVSNNNKILGIDFGMDQEFLPLHGKCFEITDREYIYKLCPFDSASQLSKNGGSDTNLGTWGEWHGDYNKYSKMKYTNGLSCWNGPNRSMDVTMSCGAKNEIVSVSEPNRCEYVMEFRTPAVCQDPATLSHSQHEEL